MKRGKNAILKNGKKRLGVTIVHDHSIDDPPYPAVTIRKGERGEEYIVGKNELMTYEELEAEEDAKELAKLEVAKESVKDIVAAFEAGNISVMAIAKHMGKQMCEVLSRARKAERLGLIKLVKEAK